MFLQRDKPPKGQHTFVGLLTYALQMNNLPIKLCLPSFPVTDFRQRALIIAYSAVPSGFHPIPCPLLGLYVAPDHKNYLIFKELCICFNVVYYHPLSLDHIWKVCQCFFVFY